ncbi:MAG: hypothetical protein K0S04_4264, partial [Herbinix sp.]|nr:hypothetical protein [Herbinix sp.]
MKGSIRKEKNYATLLYFNRYHCSELEEKGINITIPEAVTLYFGNTQRIKMQASVKSAKMVAFRSLDEGVAAVTDEVIIGQKVGSTSIYTTVLVEGNYYEYTTIVTVKPGKVIVTAEKERIQVGETTKIKTMVSSGVMKSLSYRSDQDEIAVVKKAGIYGFVEGRAVGSALITVKVGFGGKIKAGKVAIEVVNAEAPVIPVSNPMNAKDYTVKDDWQGSRVYFGHYEQDNQEANGPEPILWRVLEVAEDSILLLSEYGLICKNYNDTYENVTWETSTLRAWLNGEFLDTAFTNKEKRAIQDTVVKNEVNKNYNTSGGNDTVDKVFLLSYEEAQNNAYGFQSGVSNKSKSRQMRLTEAALVEGYANKDNGNTCWWLRSPGITNQYAAYVFSVGSITDSYYVGRRNDAVRPVIRL